jgi:hypothetical protein
MFNSSGVQLFECLPTHSTILYNILVTKLQVLVYVRTKDEINFFSSRKPLYIEELKTYNV